MERKDPTCSKPDMGDVHFRRAARQTTQPQDSGLIWKIAIGVFIGMSLLLLATCSLLGVGAAAVADQQEQQQKAAVDEFLRAANDPDPFGYGARAQEEQRREIERRALRPGQRCMQGHRIERVDGGWRDLPNDPC